MQFNRVFIPYGGYWSTPFARWQGNFAHLHPMVFAADIARNALRERDIAPEIFDTLFPYTTLFRSAFWLSLVIRRAMDRMFIIPILLAQVEKVKAKTGYGIISTLIHLPPTP